MKLVPIRADSFPWGDYFAWTIKGNITGVSVSKWTLVLIWVRMFRTLWTCFVPSEWEICGILSRGIMWFDFCFKEIICVQCWLEAKQMLVISHAEWPLEENKV